MQNPLFPNSFIELRTRDRISLKLLSEGFVLPSGLPGRKVRPSRECETSRVGEIPGVLPSMKESFVDSDTTGGLILPVTWSISSSSVPLLHGTMNPK